MIKILTDANISLSRLLKTWKRNHWAMGSGSGATSYSPWVMRVKVYALFFSIVKKVNKFSFLHTVGTYDICTIRNFPLYGSRNFRGESICEFCGCVSTCCASVINLKLVRSPHIICENVDMISLQKRVYHGCVGCTVSYSFQS